MRSQSQLSLRSLIALCLIGTCVTVTADAGSQSPKDPHGILAALRGLNCDPPGSKSSDVLDVSILNALEPAGYQNDSLDLSVLDELECDPRAKAPPPQPDKLLSASGQVLMASVSEPRPVRYPERSDLWTHPGHTREELITHLQSGVHAGKFDPTYLRLQSTAELEALHSDDHEGKATMRLTQAIAQVAMPRSSVVIPSPATPARTQPSSTKVAVVPQATSPRPAMQTVRASCPGGVCPVPRAVQNTGRQRTGPVRKLFGGLRIGKA